MSQISPPIRIVLVLAIAVLGAYMTVLKPKTEEVPPAEPAPNVQTEAPAVSKPGKIAEAAQDAVKASDGQLQKQESVDGVDAGEAAAGTQSATKGAPNAASAAAATPAVEVAGLPKPIAKAIRKHKALVLLFWNGKSADDKAVHAALKHVDRWDGRVFVRSAPIDNIAKYGRIARGVDVEQSPTVVVADSQMRAETLVGYVDSQTIDQAVVDAFRNTSGVFTDAYLRKVDAVCRDYRADLNAIPHSLATTPAQFKQVLARATAILPNFAADFRAVKAPRKWRSFRTAIAADNAATVAYYSDLAAYVGSKPTASRIVQGIGNLESRRTAVNKSYRSRMMDARLTRCVS